MPVRVTLVRQGSVQDSLIGKPRADELQPDRQAFRVKSAGKRAAWQAEHCVWSGWRRFPGRICRGLAAPSQAFGKHALTL